jgi:hypothetical protein
LDPKRTDENTLMLDPNLCTERKLIVLPRFTKSTTDKLEPIRLKLLIESEEPQKPIFRREQDAPSLTAENTLIVLPAVTKLLTLRVEPNCTNLSTLIQEPNRPNARSETEDPRCR